MEILSASATFALGGGVAGSTTIDARDAAAVLLETAFVLAAFVAFGVVVDKLETVTVLLELALTFASALLLSVFAATVAREDFVVLEVVCTAFVVAVESTALVADAGECAIGRSPARSGTDAALGCSGPATLLGAATEVFFSATAGVGLLVELALLDALRPVSGTGSDLVAFPFAGALSTGLTLVPAALTGARSCDAAAATNCRCFWLACASLEL
jgi:hypothetical protein